MPLDWAGLSAAVKLGAVVGLDRAAALVEERAKQLAPVRNIFEGASRKVRFKTMAEVKADRRIRARVGLGREYVAAPRTRLRSRRGMGKAKTALGSPDLSPIFRVRASGGLSPVAMMRLSRRGQYEVASGRADHVGFVGGRLRDEITSIPATGEGSRYTALVVSPTPYAKYQEFGTAHNAAHPYLRPALHESASEIRSVIRASIKGAIRGQRLQVEVELG